MADRTYRRIGETVSLLKCYNRLLAFRDGVIASGEYSGWRLGAGYPASCLAEVFWPGNSFLNAQGAGASASRVLKRLGCSRARFGWRLDPIDPTRGRSK